MTTEYDNDDIVEDYEVVGEEAKGARRVDSSGGGPVKRPTRQIKNDRPPTESVNALDDEADQAAMYAPKGQISQKNAKMIWYVCIGVCVLCVGAMILHYSMSEDPVPVNQSQNRRATRGGPTRPVAPPLSAAQKRIKAFKGAVNAEMRTLQASKAYLNVLDEIEAWQESKKLSD
ncbi:hypothetical protein OAU50_06635, partial [Planctomycetota bacterium]|nr:hypothetical protein [Planctomycetota bacterium]